MADKTFDPFHYDSNSRPILRSSLQGLPAQLLSQTFDVQDARRERHGWLYACLRKQLSRQPLPALSFQGGNCCHYDSLIEKALYYEYSTSADPIGAGIISQVPFVSFESSLHEQGPTQLTPLDISRQLGISYPATSPALLANFVHIHPGESIRTASNATSHLFYVIRGNGRTQIDNHLIPWSAGDFFILPHNSGALHTADADSAFYYVHDEPLLNYLGAQAHVIPLQDAGLHTYLRTLEIQFYTESSPDTMG